MNVMMAPTARGSAEWYNAVQARGAPAVRSGSRSPSPPTRGTRSPTTRRPRSWPGPFSQWPEPLGFAAIGSEELVQRFADIVRQEYLAVGIRVALHPQIDLATEPRWARQMATFGEDADLTSRLGVAYVRGLQGRRSARRRCRRWPSTSPAAARRRTARTRTSPTAASRSIPVDNSSYHLKPFKAVHRGGRRAADALLRHAGRHRTGGGRLRLQQAGDHRPAARAARLRRHRLHRLGHPEPRRAGVSRT